MKEKSYGRSVCWLLAVSIFVPAMGRAQAVQYTISTIVGNATSGYAGDGGSATQAELSNPCGLALDGSGNLYIADQSNQRIRQVLSGNINTVAGSGTAGYSGDGGAPTKANISEPCGVAVDKSGNIYFSQSDLVNSAVRKVPASGNMSTVAGTSSGAGYSGDGAAATAAQVSGPTAVALDSTGNLYIADTLNNRIRMVASSGGNINTVAGNGTTGSDGDGGAATSAAVNGPQGLAVDASGNLYIADTYNHKIRMVSGGLITTIAGTGTAGFSGDGGPATKAQLNYPKAVAVDAAGNVYIVDSFNWRIRRVAPDGTISTIAGRSANGYAGDGGLATNARLSFPRGVAVTPGGLIYISDTGNNVIRLLTPVSGDTGGGTPSPVPTITSVVSASSCGGYATAAPGSWIEIHGSALAAKPRSWTDSDFSGINAPTMLDGTQVSIGGQNAVVLYISSTQVNAQVPVNISPGEQLIKVTAGTVTSAPYTLTLNAAQPGLCQGVQISGNLYLAAVVNNTTTYILPSGANVAGVTSRPAHPGEVISFFGNGFGAVTPSPTQGQLVQQSNQLTTPLQVFFGTAPATLLYQGLAPGFIGLYQFNAVVPNIPDSDAVPVTFALGNFAGAPTLFTAVKR